MNKRINNKGFSLVEVLVALAIFGILFAIVVVSVTNMLDNQRQKYNLSQNEIFIQTAKSYINDHKTLLPKLPLEEKYVTLKQLIDDNYFTSEFVDYDKNKYDDDSRVTIRRIGDNKYSYTGRLETSKNEVINTQDIDATINFNINNINGNITEHNGDYYTNNKPLIAVSMSDSDYLAAYVYSIYKNGILYKKEEPIYITKTKNYSDVISLDTSEYKNGTYKIVLTTYDYNGGKTTNTSSKIIINVE